MNHSTIRKFALLGFLLVFILASCGTSTKDETARSQNATLTSRVDELESTNSQLTARVDELTRPTTTTSTTTPQAPASAGTVKECAGPPFVHFNDQITTLFNCDAAHTPSAISVVACSTLTSYAESAPIVISYDGDSTNASHHGDIQTSWENIIVGILIDPRVNDIVMDTTGMVVEFKQGLTETSVSDIVAQIAQGMDIFKPCAEDPYSLFLDEANQFNVKDPARCAELQAKSGDTLPYPDSSVVHPNGYFFHLDCTTGYFGWWYQGTESDTWTLTVPPGTADHTNLPMRAGDAGIPFDRKHPAYADALTLTEMVPGMTVCRRDGNKTLGDFVVKDVVLHVFDADLAYPAWHDSTQEETDPWSLEDDGVIPFENGLWSISRLTAGPC